MILKEAVRAILDKRTDYQTAMAYYEGRVPETFATVKLRKLFATMEDRSRLNFCRPVITAMANRIELASIVGDKRKTTQRIAEIWEYNNLEFEADEIHIKSMIYGESYALAWPDETGEWVISYQNPENTALVYDIENPRKKAYGVKVWVLDKRTRMNIYTADAIIKYETKGELISEGTNWTELERIDNPFGEVPMFHFMTQRPFGRPEHYDAYDAQNAINKLFITNMNTIDYQGAPQRYALANPDGELSDFDETDVDLNLKNGPGELWYLKGVNAVGEFSVADPDNFWKPIKDIVRSLAALTDTPLHYFERTGNNPTGNGLRVAEAPLLKKIQQREASFGFAWREMFMFILKAENIVDKISVYWKTHESLDEPERWDVALKKLNAGLSHRQALREGGYSDEQIELIMADRKAEAEGGLFYQRAPQTRVNTNADETHAVKEK